jgi:PAS domain S-box-containing protein
MTRLEQSGKELQKLISNLPITLRDHIYEQGKLIVELKDLLTSYEEFLQAIPEPIFIVDIQGTIEFVNLSMIKMLGFEAHELVGQSLELILPSHQPGELFADMIIAQQSNSSGITKIAQAKDGRRLTVKLSVYPTQSREHMLLYVTQGMPTPNTDENKYRAMQQQAESESEAKSNFISKLSHEIRNPLGIMLGYSDLLFLESEKDSPAHRYSKLILKSGNHLLETLNDILEYARIESGKLKIQTEKFATAGFLKDLVELFDWHARKKNIELAIRATGDVPVLVQSDSTRLRQVLINLISNAVQHTDSGSIIIEVFAQRVDSRVQLGLRIKDSGSGITKENQHRIFMPFEQADLSKGRNHEGTGLGLSLSRNIARSLGGDIALVGSAPGQGTTFEVTIDGGTFDEANWLDKKAFQDSLDGYNETSGNRNASKPLSLLNILVVEDLFDNSRLVKHILESAGARVDVAFNGMDGIVKANSAVYDLVLMDMQMPVMDGYEAVKRMRAGGYSRPVIALTAHAMKGERERCLAIGCDGYISKPIRREDLVRELVAACNRFKEKLTVEPGPSQDQRLCPSTPQVIEGNRMEPLRSTLPNDRVYMELVETFVNNMPGYLSRINHCIAAHDWEKLRGIAHQLKGSGGGYGFVELSEVSNKMEQAAAMETPDLSSIAEIELELGVLSERMKLGLN